MARTKRSKRNPKPLSPTKIYAFQRGPEEARKAVEELSNGSDRVAAIMGAVFVENPLVGYLALHFQLRDTAHFEALFYGQSAVLGTFSSRIRLARAMGLINDIEEAALDAIRRIRNNFAHSPLALTFDSPEIVEDLRLLKIPLETHWSPSRRDQFVGTCLTMGHAVADRSLARVKARRASSG